jgi:LmbE family N-acetylglucosaminyl deacetylase
VGSALDSLLSPSGAPRSLRDLVWPARLRVLVLAPHPDDFDAIGASLRHLQAQGHTLELAVLTSGASGVDDGFEGASDDAAKAKLREAEQRAACAFFGLPPERLHFLRLWESGADAAADQARLAAWMAARAADLLFLPHGNDSNRTHQRTWQAVRAIAAEQGSQAWACLNQDAKTLQMRVDLFFAFDEEEAAWKASLLRFHRSQQERNLRTRGAGFDARVLELNRRAAAGLPTKLPYAEAFELMRMTPAGA